MTHSPYAGAASTPEPTKDQVPAADTSIRTGLILAIESSCDETAAAVVERGSRTLSSVVASQVAVHSPYGGVVPELASREHLRNMVPVVRAALEQAGCTLGDVDAIAVTNGPGLAGALLVGISYAKALAYATGKPLVAVNHIEGHIHAVLLQQRQLPSNSEQRADPSMPLPLPVPLPMPLPMPLPALALVVSGGHTHLYLTRQQGSARDGGWTYQNVGRTVDDAAGEAFDKVAKLLGLGYPGGPWIDGLAPHGNSSAVAFSFAQVKAKVHRPGQRAAMPRFLFSFSGIKTAVLRYVEVHGLASSIDARNTALAAIASPVLKDVLPLCDGQTLDLIASFQRAVVGDLMQKTFTAAEALGAHSILISGGVAANRELRTRFTEEATRRGLPIAFPSLALSTDNAAMIAAAAWPKLLAGEVAPADVSAAPSLALGR